MFVRDANFKRDVLLMVSLSMMFLVLRWKIKVSIEEILGYECSQCIKLYGNCEERCGFCEEKAFYRDGLIEGDNIGNDQGADPSGIAKIFTKGKN